MCADTATPDGEHRGFRARTALFVVGALAALLLVITGVVSLLAKSDEGTTGTKNALVGTRVAGFTLPGVDGGAVKAPWRGHHAAVLLFFADFCAPCHTELPALRPTVGTGVFGATRVVGIDGDASPAVAASFVAKEHLRFPVAHDANLVVASELVPEGFPAAVFVKSDGTVAAVHYGALSTSQLRAGLVELR